LIFISLKAKWPERWPFCILFQRTSGSRPLPSLVAFSLWGLSPAVVASRPSSRRFSAAFPGFSPRFFRGSPLSVDFGSATSAGFCSGQLLVVVDSINRLFTKVDIFLFLTICEGQAPITQAQKENNVYPRFFLARLRSFVVNSKPSFLSFFSAGSPVLRSQSRSL